MKRALMDYTLFSLLVTGFLLAIMPAPLSQASSQKSDVLPLKAPLGFPAVEAVASYSIEVQFDPENKLITGREWITYTNTTQAPIPDLVFHLYLNAFRDSNTIFLKDSGGSHRMNTWDPQSPGWIDISRMRLQGGDDLVVEYLEDGTLAHADLPSPVQPGESVNLEVEFQALLPRVFARTGFAEDAQGDLYFMVGQWFPKLGVWEDTGWNAYPFYEYGEFYADFGVYDVAITLPGQYVTTATGVLVDRTQNADGSQTVKYHASGVIDFAWAASPNFLETSREVDGVDLVYVYLPEHGWTAKRVLDAAESALRSFSAWFGPYPYPRLTVLDAPDSGEGAGGMEYPTLVTAGVVDGLGVGEGPARLGADRTLELVVIHEVAHQWWQSMVAFNEVEEPWLDEGFTDYATARAYLTGDAPSSYHLSFAGVEIDPLQVRRVEYATQPDISSYGPAWEFNSALELSGRVYAKPMLSLTTLENILGEETMLDVMSTFFQRYQYAHPGTEEFREVAEEVSGVDLDWFFEGLVYGSGTLNYAVQELTDHSVQVARHGDLVIPTEVLVTFSDGEQVLEPWDGVQAEMTFTYPDRPPIQSAWVDPEQKIVVDLVWMDNGLARQPDLPAWMALFTRIWAGLQSWTLAWGGF